MSGAAVDARASLALDLQLNNSTLDGEPPGRDQETVVAEAPYEQLLRGAVQQLLQETTTEKEGFAYLRDICAATLAAKGRVTDAAKVGANMADSADAVSSPRQPELVAAPKSPQERIRALVPNAIEKGKSRYGRRTQQAGQVEIPRWKPIEAEDQRPITDLVCIFTGDAVPEGFSKIERSPTGQRADLSKGGGGVFVYLCVCRDKSANKLPISEILVIFPDRGEFVPTDYEIVQRRGNPANINYGTQGERIYICFKRSANSSIVDIVVLFPRKGDKLPYGFMKVDRTPDNYYADLNATTGGTEVFLSYRKTLNCLNDAYSHWLTVAGDDNATRRSNALTSESPRRSDDAEGSMAANCCSLPRAGGDVAQPSEWTEFYFYPLLLACYTRHGVAADSAIQSLLQCFDTGVFDDESVRYSRLCRLEVIVEALTSVCHQGVKSRFAMILPFYRKIVRKFTTGFPPRILHATLKSLIFIGDFDSSLVKSVEDELVYKVMGQYEAERVEKRTKNDQQRRLTTLDSACEIAASILLELIDDITDGVDIAKATEQLLGVFKSHASIHSPMFCTELLHALDVARYSAAQKNAFQVIITLTKSVSRKVFTTSESGPDREQISIVNALRALNFALHAAGTNVREHRSFGQMIRRFVFSTMNSTALIWSSEVFRASLTLISTLWNHYRRHLKIEFALLFEHLFLRILRSTSTGATSNQIAIMDELTPWFQLPHNVVEVFLNYDMERVQQWKIFEHLCAALCSIAEGSSSLVAEDTSESSPVKLQIQAITTILAIARSVMDASGHAHLINRDARTRLLSMEHGGWEQDESVDDGGVPPTPLSSPANEVTSPPFASSPDLKDKEGGLSRRLNHKIGSINVRMRNEIQKRNQQLLKRAMEIASSKSLKKAIEYLVAMNFVKDTPRDITSFLRIYHDFFDEAETGDYLGEGDEDFKVQVRLTYVRAISFKGMSLVESLRHFLTNGGFRLPGEAQKIERMVEAFSQCFYEDSPSSFSSADTAMIIAYSIIMLNTDLHNPQVKKNKMSREQFIKNNRGIDNGKDLPRRFLEEVYDDIAHHPMHIKGSRFVPKSRESTLSLVDLDIDKFRTSVARSVTQSEELMKDLSQSYFTFNFVGVDTSISPELIKVLFERVWFYLLALSTSILYDSQSDLTLTMHCLDLLRFCISTCLFLGMTVERRAFCNLLTKVHAMLEDQAMAGLDEDGNTGVPTVAKEWLENIESAATNDDPWRVMGDIHMLCNKMKDTIQRRQRSEELNSVIKRINRGSYYLKDTTHFIREGDLTKKCRSRNQTYRFFLFNDQLLYADKGMSGYWNPHNSLRLKLTRISDVAETVMNKHAFQISNPVKSFIVFADSAHTKMEWMRLIEDAINDATKKIALNARRLSYRTMLSPTSDEAQKSAPSPGSPSALASSASNAMKSFMRRNSRLSPPLEMDNSGTSEVILTMDPVVSPLVVDEEQGESMMRDDAADQMVEAVAISEETNVFKIDDCDLEADEDKTRPETEANQTPSTEDLPCENQGTASAVRNAVADSSSRPVEEAVA